jgi:hypothetical protein
MGGIAAVAAAEYAGARRPGLGSPVDLAAVGRPSEVALKALERVEAASGDETGRAEAEPDGATEEQPAPEAALDPWRDLPGG